MTIEMPWVIDTRLAPGQKPRRNPLWGILAAVGAVIHVAAFFIAMAVVFSAASELLFWMLPVWGIFTLATLGSCIAAFAARGALNVSLAAISLFLSALFNPLIALMIALLVGA